MAAAELDVSRLSIFCSIPQSSITTLLDSPTSDLVKTLLENISSRIIEYEDTKSAKLRTDVELENAVRGGEAKNRVLRNAVDKSHRDADDLRQQLRVEENLRRSTESELDALKASTSASTSEAETFKARISSLEASNRDTLSILESKSTTCDKIAEELSAQHLKTQDLRKEISALEQEAQNAYAATSSAKFHEQSLQQEIEHLKRNNDWLDKELKTKSQEYTKYRKDKSVRIAELQRHNEEATNDADALRHSERALRSRVEELGQKIEEQLVRIQNLGNEATARTEQFNVELNSANRLAELTRNAANNERSRHQDLLAQLENIKEASQEEVARLGAELDTEHGLREDAERRIEQFESQVENLEAEIGKLRSQDRADGMFNTVVNGHSSSPRRDGSPAFRAFSSTPSRLKGGLTFTQLYSEYSELKSQLAAERQHRDRLQTSVDEMIQDLESSRPEVEEVRAENNQLHANIDEMSSLLDVVGKEKDLAMRNVRKIEGQIEVKSREGEVLRQQIRDLSTQVKILLFEIDRRDKGLRDFSAEQQLQLERLARSEWNDEVAEGISDTDRLINEELVMFRDIAQLQQQNSKLLNLTRQLGDQMEREEASRKEKEAAKDPKDYKQLYERCQDEIKSLVTQSHSYIRERDMFRRMLTHRGAIPRGSDINSMFGESVNGAEAPATPSHVGPLDGVNQSPISKEMTDYAKLLKEMQAHFDAYRNEASIDRSTLREQVDSLSKTNSELRSEVSRCQGQAMLDHERFEMLQANYAMLKGENTELQKRLQFYSDNAAKQDLRTQQAAEDLVEVKGLLDSMRNENANLKAEREFSKSIEKRLTEDNETHFNERNRLNSLNASLQTLLNERERSETETRRKLQAQVDAHEKDLQEVRNNLAREAEELKRAIARREYDNQQSQKKIDDLVSGLSLAREGLVAAKTTKDHLQIRVDELTIELRSAEERVQVLQPPPAPQTADSGDAEALNDGNAALTKEQDLAVQVSELKRDLELTKAELENARNQVEQYKAISQSSEEELQSLNEAQELYRQEMDSTIDNRDATIRQLEQRIKDTESELSATDLELSTLRRKEIENGRRLAEQKSAFETEITQLKDQDDRHATAAKYHQEDLKAQAEIAQQAQQNYENELVKHADAAKALQRVRSEYNDLKIEIVGLKVDAESARSSLAQNEESWAESRERYERELSDLKTGRENLNAQNERLHQQLDNLGSQISGLQKHPITNEIDGSAEPPTASGIENLQEIIKYLRREKEIVDVQLELSAQEAKRLKQQLDYVQSQLDDTRLKLSQQRRQEMDSERTALNHTKLMETINELNTFRESNVTLRNESRMAQASLAQKVKEVKDLADQIDPLRVEVRELQNDKETQLGETRLLQEDRDRWRQRTQDILQKYDRVDPAELEALKTQISTLEIERNDLVLAKQSLEEQLITQNTQAQEQSKEKVEDLKSRLTEQFKARSKQLSNTIREKDTSLQAAFKDKQDLEQRLASLQEELESLRSERDTAISNATAAQVNGADLGAPNGSEDGQVHEESAPRPTQEDLQRLQNEVSTATSRLSEETTRSEGLQEQIATSRSTIATLEGEIGRLQEKLDAMTAELSNVQKQQQQENQDVPNEASLAQLEKLQEELEQARQDSINLRAAAAIQPNPAEGTSQDNARSAADQLSESVTGIRAELEQRHSERVQKAEETLQKRTDNMRAQLTRKLAEGKEQMRKAVVAEKDQELQALRLAHAQTIESLEKRHRDELDELRHNEETRFAQFKDSLTVQHPTQEATVETNVKKEGTVPGPLWEPSDAEAKQFIASNATVKSILWRNISQKVSEATSKLSTQMKEEHASELAQKLEDAQTKANTTKEQAVMMESKRVGVKLSMLENRTRLTQLKLDLFEKAAQDTPQKPVQEVWTVVKNAKPTMAVQQPQHNASASQGQPRSGTFGQPTPLTQIQKAQPSEASLQGRLMQTSTPSSRQQQQQLDSSTDKLQTQSGQQAEARNSSPNEGKTQTKPQQQQQQQQQQPQVEAISATQASQTQDPPSANQQPSAPQNTTNIPSKPSQGPNNHHPNSGTGPAVFRGMQQSGLPVARGGGPNRVMSRGRGQAGRGRGGAQQIDTNRPQQPQATASPSQLSGAAKQFVPQGNKRPREGSEGVHVGDGGNGKRLRGGGAGS
ncbi:MAG: hypothetical protein Q9190_004717 [Brigantiaea leucoxantha]